MLHSDYSVLFFVFIRFYLIRRAMWRICQKIPTRHSYVEFARRADWADRRRLLLTYYALLHPTRRDPANVDREWAPCQFIYKISLQNMPVNSLH